MAKLGPPRPRQSTRQWFLVDSASHESSGAHLGPPPYALGAHRAPGSSVVLRFLSLVDPAPPLLTAST